MGVWESPTEHEVVLKDTAPLWERTMADVHLGRRIKPNLGPRDSSYIRVGDGDEPMTAQEVEDLLVGSTQPT